MTCPSVKRLSVFHLDEIDSYSTTLWRLSGSTLKTNLRSDIDVSTLKVCKIFLTIWLTTNRQHSSLNLIQSILAIVLQAFYSKSEADNSQASSQHKLVNFKLWLATLIGVVLAILFALIGSIFAVINFVMTPRGTITGPVGLVIWNASACKY